MVSSSQVISDSNDIETFFNKYLNSVESCKQGNVWEGASCDNFVNKANEFCNQYKSNILNQMFKFSEAISVYEKYKESENIKNSAKNKLNNSTTEEEKTSYQKEFSDAQAKMNDFEQQIKSILSEIVSYIINDTVKTQIENLFSGKLNFEMRSSYPKKGDKWYSTSDNGYIARNIGTTNPQCTWYAQGRFNEVAEITGNSSINIRGNAIAMVKAAQENGFDVSYDINNVKAGDMLVYKHNNAGHVVFVEKVNDDGSYVITSGNDDHSKNGGYFAVKTRTYKNSKELSNFIKGSSYSFHGVIHQTNKK